MSNSGSVFSLRSGLVSIRVRIVVRVRFLLSVWRGIWRYGSLHNTALKFCAIPNLT